MQRLARRGDLSRLGIGPAQLWLLNRPDLAEYMLDTHEDGFDKGRGISTRFLGEGMLTLEGGEHDARRDIVQPGFTSEAVRPHAEAIVELARRMVQEWMGRGEVDVQEEMGRLNVAVAVAAFFGLDPHSVRGRELTAALEEASAAAAKPLARRRFASARARLDELIAGLVRETRAGGGGRGSALAALAEVGEASLPDQAIRNELVTMYSGHNSVGLGLSWTLYLVAANPPVADRLQRELEALDGPPTGADLERLEFARACVSEGLRLFPPIWLLVRRAVRGHELDAQAIPEGAMLVTSQYLLQRDERYWSDPDGYRPERWLDPDGDRPRFAYFPFGGGSRDCLGEAFAWMETTLTLATVLQGARVAPVPGAEVRPRARVKLAARDGVPLRVETSPG